MRPRAALRKKLSLPKSKAITDATILIALLPSAIANSTSTAASQAKGCSFIPSIAPANKASESWKKICQQANLSYIDPRWPVKKVLSALLSSDRILTEDKQAALTLH